MAPPDAGAAAVLAAVRAMLPAGVACAGGTLDGADPLFPDQLFPDELAAIACAGLKRRREFSAGRGYARQALAQLGLAAQALPVTPTRAPRWPDGIVGSITHTDRLAAAVAARADAFLGIGLDLEDDAPLDAGVRALVCSAAELAGFEPVEAGGPSLPKLLFVAKEAVYKLYHPLAGHFLEFHDVTVSVDLARGRFRATLAAACPAAAGRRVFDGQFRHAAGVLAALALLERE